MCPWAPHMRLTKINPAWLLGESTEEREQSMVGERQSAGWLLQGQTLPPTNLHHLSHQFPTLIQASSCLGPYIQISNLLHAFLGSGYPVMIQAMEGKLLAFSHGLCGLCIFGGCFCDLAQCRGAVAETIWPVKSEIFTLQKRLTPLEGARVLALLEAGGYCHL